MLFFDVFKYVLRFGFLSSSKKMTDEGLSCIRDLREDYGQLLRFFIFESKEDAFSSSREVTLICRIN